MKILGIAVGLLSAYLFYAATLSTVPTDGAYALGYNLGSHAAWIICAILSYVLLRKK
jgi:hypothetical protein